MIDLSLGHIRLPIEQASSPVEAVASYGDPAGHEDLRGLLADRHQVPATSVTVTTGSSMGITAALSSRRPPVVLLPRPYYPAFPSTAALLGLTYEFYDAEARHGPAGAADARSCGTTPTTRPGRSTTRSAARKFSPPPMTPTLK